MVAKGTRTATKESSKIEGGDDDLWGVEHMEGKKPFYLRSQACNPRGGSARNKIRGQLQKECLWGARV